MTTNIHGFWNFGQSIRILIVLACFASARAGSLQDAVIKDGCSKYQDPKSVEPLKKFVEPAMEKGCVACHLDCNKLSPADQKEPPEFYLKAKEPAVCLECHGSPGKKDLSPAHDNQPLGKSKCTGCHDPHSSDVPKLLPKFSHGPYAARLCSACHPAPKGKVGLSAANVDALCYDCHTNFKAEMAGAGSKHKLLSQSDRSCTECHDPHAANQEFHLKKPVQDLCVSCHDEKPQQTAPGDAFANPDTQYLKLSSKHVHEPAKKSCLICHDAHASQFPKELRVSERDLCMNCHGPNSEKIVQSSQPFPLFNGLVSLPPKTFEKLRLFELTGKYVHEPVNVSCSFCHDAHASDNAMELYAPVTDLCLACHGFNGIQLMRSKQPFPLFGGKISVPPKSFEKLMILDLTSARLGHPTAKHPVNVAATKDKAELNCITCHDSHSASTGPKLLRTDKKATCQKCHEM
ncbi:MAG TPA: cytochrome c3 family protein [Acidobacteriota bacterium]|nr:cytochrome c3 family protein [Acidobacteriota bacterium]